MALATAVSALLGALAPVAPTEILAVDVVYRAAFAAALAFTAADARRWSHLVAGGLALAGTGGALPWSALAAFALGVSVVAVERDRPGRVYGAVVGAICAQVALRLEWPATHWATAAIAAAITGVLLASGIRNMRRSRKRWSRRLAFGIAIAGGGAVLLTAAGAAAIRPDVTQGIRSAEDGLAAARRGDSAGASTEFDRAEDHLAAARGGIDGPLLVPARLVPVVGRYVAAGSDVLHAAENLADTAGRAAAAGSADGLRLRDGRIDPAAVAAVEEPLARASAATGPAREAVAALRAEWLPSSAAGRVDRLDDRLAEAQEDARVALQVAEVAPSLLGASAERRYLLVVQSPAEQRGTGGIVGAFADLTVNDGALRLARVGRHRDLGLPSGTEPFGPEDYRRRYRDIGPWIFPVNASYSPDFPSVAEVLREMYSRTSGHQVDGVISVDPVSLAALLELTGPVTVPGWPEPLTADNATQVLLHEQYVALTADAAEREEFLAAALQTIFGRLLSGDLPGPAVIARHLSPVAATDHLMVWMADGREQLALETVEVTGAVADVERDYLQVVTHNASQTKIEWFQRRSVSYDVRYDPATGVVRSIARVQIHNNAPPGGLPPYVIGGARGFINSAPGEDRLWLNLYSPLRLNGAVVDGVPVEFRTERELGRLVHSAVIAVPAQSSVVVEFDLSGAVTPGSYRLAVDQQPTVTPDALDVSVELAKPWGAAGRTRWSFRDGRDRKFVIETVLDGFSS